MTAKERTELLKRTRSQEVKHKLLEYILENRNISNVRLNELLGYNDNFNNLYTLKNRLFDDIIALKIEINKNPYIIAKEKIQNLRTLVYSRDKITLLRELKKYEKLATQYELFSELKEIYFCFFLLNKNESAKRENFLRLMNEQDVKIKNAYALEEIFYAYLLDAQDLFYFDNPQKYQELKSMLNKMKKLHEQQQTKSSFFLYQSALLTLEINRKKNIEKNKIKDRHIEDLQKAYTYSFLQYKYPNCSLPILCLLNKYYLVIGDKEKFDETFEELHSQIQELRGYSMFDDSFFYFLYVSILREAEKGHHTRIANLLDRYITEEEIALKNERTKNYYQYLLSLRHFYKSEYEKCQRALVVGRAFFNALDDLSYWLCIENILLSIIINLKQKDFEMLQSEISMLKRKCMRNTYYETYAEYFKPMTKLVKSYEHKGNMEELKNYFVKIRSSLGFLKLIDLSVLF
ncbi:MAG: hypothetical protein NZ529_02635 [Cytophagaceae bacterium]|nr:hypothetical protein [Cytophagaceae bacterium]MDW8455667.1 hypothetical protein [Cytophagaceae bacterium]